MNLNALEAIVDVIGKCSSDSKKFRVIGYVFENVKNMVKLWIRLHENWKKLNQAQQQVKTSDTDSAMQKKVSLKKSYQIWGLRKMMDNVFTIIFLPIDMILES